MPINGTSGTKAPEAAIDDPARFTSSRTVGAHFGVTSQRFRLGNRTIPGHFSQATPKCARRSTSPQTRAPIQWGSWLKAGTRLIKTKGRRRAVVAVAPQARRHSASHVG